jgi:capsular polysaccharide biosynthesis protein
MFEVANEVVELEPGTVWDTEPAICLPNEIERARAFTGPEDMNRSRVLGGPRSEGPTKAYRYDDSLVADFTVYARGSYQVYRHGGKRPVLWGPADEIDSAQLCTTYNAQVYFGHFFHDSLVLEELAAQRGLTPLTFTQRPWDHEPGYRRLFDRQAVATNLARARHLWLVDERDLNAGWVARFAALRRRLREKVKPAGPTQIFITRGRKHTGRTLANEGEIAELLNGRGFAILEPEREEPAHIAAQLAGAQLVVCLAGSAEAHALVALPPGATIIEIQVPALFGAIGKILADAIDAHWGFVVADERDGGFHLDPERLFRTLDLVR